MIRPDVTVHPLASKMANPVGAPAGRPYYNTGGGERLRPDRVLGLAINFRNQQDAAFTAKQSPRILGHRAGWASGASEGLAIGDDRYRGGASRDGAVVGATAGGRTRDLRQYPFFVATGIDLWDFGQTVSRDAPAGPLYTGGADLGHLAASAGIDDRCPLCPSGPLSGRARPTKRLSICHPAGAVIRPLYALSPGLAPGLGARRTDRRGGNQAGCWAWS